MRLLLITILSFVSFISFSHAQNSPQLIQIDPQTWDFGTISDAKMVQHIFKITNHSDKNVNITKVDAPCGCMFAKVNPPMLTPGGSGDLIVMFQPKGRRSKYRWQINIKTDLEQQPAVVVPMEAYILVDDIISTNFVSMGVFKKGAKKEGEIWMVYPKKPDFKILSVTTDLQGFEISFNENPQVEGFYPGNQRGYLIRVNYKPDVDYGRHMGNIKIETDIPEKKFIDIAFFAYINGDITAAPDDIPLGILKPGETKERRITVSHNQFAEFNITKIEKSIPFIETRVQEVIPHKYYYVFMTLKVPADINPGEFRGNIVIHTDCPTHPRINILLQGIIGEK